MIESGAEYPAILRVNKNTRSAATQFCASQPHWRRFVVSASGLIANPDLPETLAQTAACEIILDPEVAEAASTAFGDDLARKLPWAATAATTPGEETEEDIAGAAMSLADFVGDHFIDAVLAPSHLLGQQDAAWLKVDRCWFLALRAALDASGCKHVAMDYNLLVPLARLQDPGWRALALEFLKQLPFRQLWIRTGPFGIGASHDTRRLAEALEAFRKLDRPVILDHAGGLAGLAPLVFGQADGICHGVASKLDCDFQHWTRAPSSGAPSLSGRREYYEPTMDRMMRSFEIEQLDSLRKRHKRVLRWLELPDIDAETGRPDKSLGHFLHHTARLHKKLLTPVPENDQSEMHSLIWTSQKAIETSLLKTSQTSPAGRLLKVSLDQLSILREALPSAAPQTVQRRGLDFSGRDFSDRPFILRTTPPPRRQQQRPAEDPDILDDTDSD